MSQEKIFDNCHVVGDEKNPQKQPKWTWGLHKLLAYFIEPVKNLCRSSLGYIVTQMDMLVDLHTELKGVSNRLANVEKALTTLLKAQESDSKIIINDLANQSKSLRNEFAVDMKAILKKLVDLKKQMDEMDREQVEIASADVIDYTEEKAATDKIVREMKEDGVKDEDIENILSDRDRQLLAGE